MVLSTKKKKVDEGFRSYDMKRIPDRDSIPKTSQSEITLMVLKQLDIPITKTSFKKMMRTLWWRHRLSGNDHDLRLTKEGVDILNRQLNIKAYSYSLPWVHHFKSTMCLYMARNLTGPYYVSKTEIVVFGLTNYLKFEWFMTIKRRHGLTQALATDFSPIVYEHIHCGFDMDEAVAKHMAIENEHDILNISTGKALCMAKARAQLKKIDKSKNTP